MGRHGEAFAPLVRAIQLDAKNATAHQGIGYAYLHGDNYTKSVGFFKSAIRLDPEYSEAVYGLGLAYLKLGNKAGAEAQLKLLEKLDANLAEELAAKMNGK
jgi:anaphase-promoting complex subunit 3